MLRWRGAVRPRPFNYGWVILALGLGAHVVDAALRQGFSALAPFFQPELGISRAQVGLLASAMSLGGVLLLLPAGRLCDRLSLRAALSGGLTIMAAALLCVAVVDSYLFLWILLFITGLGHAWVTPSTGRATAYWFSAQARGTAMSIKQTGNPLGGILAATLLPPIALVAGWRAAIASLGVATLGVVLLVVLFARERPIIPGAGRAQAAVGLHKVLCQPALWAASLVAAAFSAAQFVTTTYLALYAKEVHALDAVTAATFLAWALAGGAFGRIFWGVVSDRLCRGARGPVLALIGVIACAAAASFAVARGPWPAPLLALAAVALGASAIGWNGVYLTVLAEIAGPGAIGTVTAVGLLVTNIGLVSGPPVFGWIVDVTGSYQWAWAAIAATNALGAAASWLWMREAARRW